MKESRNYSVLLTRMYNYLLIGTFHARGTKSTSLFFITLYYYEKSKQSIKQAEVCEADLKKQHMRCTMFQKSIWTPGCLTSQGKEFGLSEMCFFCDAYRDAALFKIIMCTYTNAELPLPWTITLTNISLFTRRPLAECCHIRDVCSVKSELDITNVLMLNFRMKSKAFLTYFGL